MDAKFEKKHPEIALVKARYTDPSTHPETAFTSNTQKLLKGIKGEQARHRAQQWLKKQEAYVLTRPAPAGKGKFPRQQWITGGVDDCWQLDLSDMGTDPQMLAANQRFRFILVGIDQFSRYVMAVAMKSKDGPTVAKAFDAMLRKAGTARTPIKIATDHGSEFYNPHFKEVIKNWGITDHYSPNDGDIKCGHIERVIRTLKEMTYVYFHQRNDNKWTDVLPHIVRSYNHTRHTSLGTSPLAVLHMQGEDLEKQWQRQHGKPLNLRQCKTLQKDQEAFKKGDLVRLSVRKSRFSKGYKPRFSRESFRVIKVIYRKPRIGYKVMSVKGEPIEGIMYREQLQKHVGAPSIGRVIEKVVHNDGKGKVTVKFLGWPEAYNQTMTIDKYNQLVRRENSRYVKLEPPVVGSDQEEEYGDEGAKARAAIQASTDPADYPS